MNRGAPGEGPLLPTANDSAGLADECLDVKFVFANVQSLPVDQGLSSPKQ